MGGERQHFWQHTFITVLAQTIQDGVLFQHAVASAAEAADMALAKFDSRFPGVS